MFAWGNEDVECNAGVVRCLARSGQTETLDPWELLNHRIAESLNHRGAHFAESSSREASA